MNSALVYAAMPKGKQISKPSVIMPMLATLVKQPFQDDSYVYEVKWDGYRIIAHCFDGHIKLQSRGGEDYTNKYPTIVRSLKSLNLDCILDGEVIYLNSEGKPDFDALQKVNGHDAPLAYYVFDALWYETRKLVDLPLLKRKDVLRKLLAGDNPAIKYSDHFDDGLQLFEQIKVLGLEGIVAKKKESKYHQGARTRDWLKMPTEKRQEFVIGGWVESKKRNTFRTLLFGSYDKGGLKWIGHAGGGFKEREMPVILNKLKAIEIKKTPFTNEVDYSEGTPHWVKPILVANIKFSTVTKAGRIRKPAIFLGFRDDKKSTEVTVETPIDVPQAIIREKKGSTSIHQSPHGNNALEKRGLPTWPGSHWPELERELIRNKDEFDFDDCSITLYNVDKEIWKGITKADLIQYYHRISSYMLPHLQSRPLSLHVKPKGPNVPGLYIKDMEGRQPACGAIFTTPRKHKKQGKRDVIDYLVCNNNATLLYTINLGCIDVNPWTAVTKDPLHPNFIVIDLDPSDEDFQKAVETARAAKQLFDDRRLKAFPKTSGKTGIHLFVPCSGFSFPQARFIAEHICDDIHRLVPAITSTSITVSDRGTKLYVDPNQNDYADTVASVYSVRPFRSPNVSTPLEWKELKQGLEASDFNIKSIHNRLSKKGDLFGNVHDTKIAIGNNPKLKRFL